MNIISVFRLLSFITIFVASIMGVPLIMADELGETEAFYAFAMTIAMMFIMAFAVILLTQKKHKEIKISVRDSYLFVTFTWLLLSFFGAMPLYITKTLPSFSKCYFEIMSGFTTTGATAIENIEILPRSILFWRNMTNWLGGMGIVVLFVAILPEFGVRGSNLVGAESVGPTKDKLTPKIRHTAMALWSIYIGLSIIQTVLLLLGGLSLFDAATVTFGTMGAAGFAPKNASIGAYGSTYIEWVCIVFMFLAGINFALYFRVLKGQLKKAACDGELRVYASIILVATLLSALSLFSRGLYTLSESIRMAAFHVVSFITTTGFMATNYNDWPYLPQVILFTLSFIGGCAGSAGGGIKVIRVAAMAKVGKNSIIRRVHPNAVTKIKIGNDTISDDTVMSIAGFIGMYFITLLLGTVAVSFANFDVLTSFSSAALCLGNIGLGLGGIGTEMSFAVFPDWTQWVFSFLMLAGRLELFTVYALFSRSFWKV